MGGNGLYLDHAESHILSEVMVDNIDFLSVGGGSLVGAQFPVH